MSTVVGAEAAPEGVIPNFENPEDVLHTINQVTQILSMILITLFYFMRMYVRLWVVRSPGKEDVACTFAWILAMIFNVAGLLMGKYGGGYHQWEITQETFKHYNHALYGEVIIYGPAAFFTKLSLLLILARVFAPHKGTIIFIYTFMGVMLAFYIPVEIIKIQICTPISGFWDATIETKCVNTDSLFIADTVMSVVSDLILMLLPVPLVWSLQITLKKKIGICALLGAGGLAFATSVIRLVIILSLTGQDNTISGIQFNLLGTAEIAIGIICACFPSLNIFFANRNQARRSRKAEYTSETKLSKLKLSKRLSAIGSGVMVSNYVEVSSPREAPFIRQPDDSVLEGSYTCSISASPQQSREHETTKKPREWIQGPL